MTVSTARTASWHLRAELTRLVGSLAGHLRRQRQHGRTPGAEAMRGYVVEEGESEGLLASLADEWQESSRYERRRPPRTRRQEIAERADHGAQAGAVLPLRHAMKAFDLDPVEYDALLLALAVELDGRFGRVVAYLNDHIAHTRPTVGLAIALAAEERSTEPQEEVLGFLQRPVVRNGLLEVEGEGPIPGLALRVPRETLPRLVGSVTDVPSGASWTHHTLNSSLLDRLILTEREREAASRWADCVRAGPGEAPPFIVAGGAGSGRTALARAAVSRAGLSLVTVEIDPLRTTESLRVGRREATWNAAALCAEWHQAPPTGVHWQSWWSELALAARPILVTLPPEMVEDVAAAAQREPVVIHLTLPSSAHRARLWKALLPRTASVSDGEVERLAGRFRFAPGRIVRTMRKALAEADARAPERRQLTPADLERASRDVGAAAMGALAQKMSLPYERADLVVPASVAAELDLATAWLRHRHTVIEQWGFGRRISLGRGLTALFAGRPGTGKTMAAQVLARELDSDLYRVDLSRVMSKYIGDTEKNLARLFDESEASGAVLFFDEADALFGKRSEVKDAHDRYANVEIGYLLQRMEEYEGATILATNRLRDLDEAFIRRFHVIAHFPMPEAADRHRIWEQMLPAASGRGADLDLATLGREFEVSGGEIRNAVLAAAYLAAVDGRPIGMVHLKRGLHRELLKNGRVLTERELKAIA